MHYLLAKTTLKLIINSDSQGPTENVQMQSVPHKVLEAMSTLPVSIPCYSVCDLITALPTAYVKVGLNSTLERSQMLTEGQMKFLEMFVHSSHTNIPSVIYINITLTPCKEDELMTVESSGHGTVGRNSPAVESSELAV